MQGQKVSRRSMWIVARSQAYLLAAVSLLALGLFVLWLSDENINWGRELGAALFATGLIATVWQVAVDRWQLEAQKQAVRAALSETKPTLGLTELRIGDIEKTELQTMLSGAKELMAVCLFDTRWRDVWRTSLQDFVRAGGRVRFCSPDPEDRLLMLSLAARHSEAASDAARLTQSPEMDLPKFDRDVREVLAVFQSLALEYPKRVKVRTTPAPGPSYTGYLMRRKFGGGWGMARAYMHRMGEGDALVEHSFMQGGQLFAHHERDFNRLWERSNAYPRPDGYTSESTVRIGVIGPGDASADLYEAAHAVGAMLADAPDVILITGGLGGVMEAAAAGAEERRADSRRVGYLPGSSARSANPHLSAAIATGLGEHRDMVLVDRCDAVIAIGCNEGTLIEAAYARKRHTPVYSFAFPDIMMPDGELLTRQRDRLETTVTSALLDARERRARRQTP